jgi:hypothetical protein
VPQATPEFDTLVAETELASLTVLHEAVIKYLQEDSVDGGM